jgi:hypothetical protein
VVVVEVTGLSSTVVQADMAAINAAATHREVSVFIMNEG